MKKKKSLIILFIFILTILSGCSSKLMKMSLEELGNAVINNRSMVGAGSIISDNIKNTISFDNNDDNKMKYITNNMHSDGFNINADVEIEKGLYYEAYTEMNGAKTFRGIICFVQFKDVESAAAALSNIEENLNSSSNSDGSCNLGCTAVSLKKNVICVIATQEAQPCFELKRVFEDNTYTE